MVAMQPEMEFTKLSYLAISSDGKNWQPMNPDAIVVPAGENIGTDSYFELYCRSLTRLNAAGDLQYEPLFPEDLDLSAAKFFHCAAEGHSNEGVCGDIKIDFAPLGAIHPHLWHRSRPTVRDDLIFQCNPSFRSENSAAQLYHDHSTAGWSVGDIKGDTSSLAKVYEEALMCYVEGLFRYKRFEAVCDFLTRGINSALYVQHVRDEIFDDLKMWRDSLDSLLVSMLYPSSKTRECSLPLLGSLSDSVASFCKIDEHGKKWQAKLEDEAVPSALLPNTFVAIIDSNNQIDAFAKRGLTNSMKLRRDALSSHKERGAASRLNRTMHEPLSRKVASIARHLREYSVAFAWIGEVLEFISSEVLKADKPIPLHGAESIRLRARASAIWEITASLPEESFVLGCLTPPSPRQYLRAADLPEAIRLRSKNSPDWIVKGQTAARKAGAGIDMPMRLLIQFTKHWNAFPEHREDMLKDAPSETGSAVHRAALSAVVHSLCERDGEKIPEWVFGVHAGGEYLINGDIADTEYGRLIKAQSPAVCSNYGVYFEKEMLASR